MSSSGLSPASSGPDVRDVQDWADLVAEVWEFLASRGAVVNYNFVDMTIEVPRDTGENAPRATWKLNGMVRVTTNDRDFPGDAGGNAEGRQLDDQ